MHVLGLDFRGVGLLSILAMHALSCARIEEASGSDNPSVRLTLKSYFEELEKI